MSPHVSVLTAVRNGANYLPQAIESIRRQTITDWEYIIVDDASDDESVAIVEREATADPRIRLERRSERGGPYVAANDGLAVAAGAYIARLDADDVAPPTRLEVQVGYMARNPHLRACGGFHRVLSAAGELRSSTVRVPVLPGVLRWRLCAGADPVHSSAFVERSALQELGGYAPLPLAQDWRLWCELSRRGWLGIVPDVVAYRRIHDQRITVLEWDEQSRFALEVAQEHIAQLSGQSWSLAEVQLLRDAAHGRNARISDGLHILQRWRQAWAADRSLTNDERDELGSWTRLLKRRHVLRSAERLPWAGPVIRLGSGAGRAALRTASSVARPLRRARAGGGEDGHIQRRSRASSGSGSSP